MKNSGKIAAVGDKDVILAFKTLGIQVFPVGQEAQIKETIKSLAEQEYSIILITEKEAQKINEFLNKIKMQPYPIILPIPDGVNRINFGMDKVIENMEKVIGKNAINREIKK